MTSATTRIEAPRPSAGRKVSAYLHRHSRVRVAGLVAAPLLWLGAIYLVALLALFVTAFWRVDFGVNVTRDWNLDNFRKMFQEDVYRTVVLRTIAVAAAVTVIDAVLALPVAFYMAKVARPLVAKVLVVALLTPLWASYLVKAFAWRAMVTPGGVLESRVRLDARASASPPWSSRWPTSGSRSWCCRSTRASSGCPTPCSRRRVT